MFQISLAAARVNSYLIQEEAAEKLGITAKTLRGYEQGKTAIPPTVLDAASILYGIPLDFIRLEIVKDGNFEEVS